MYGTVNIIIRIQTNLNSEQATFSTGKWEFFVTVTSDSISTHRVLKFEL